MIDTVSHKAVEVLQGTNSKFKKGDDEEEKEYLLFS